MYRIIATLCAGLLAVPAHAESLLQRVAGAWTLTSGSEKMADGTVNELWGAGSLILDPSGHMSFFVFGKNRPPATSPDPRAPLGPMVAYYGTFTVDDDTKTLTYHVEAASSPMFNAATRMQTVTLSGETMTTTGSTVNTPQGVITPINVWKRAK
jgi:Lipocalin-like domain